MLHRLIDTAFIYGGEQTEKEVGRALTTAMSNPNLSRKEIFITTKQWRAYHGYEETLKCLDLSLKRLKLDYVDLYLIHWPGPAYSTMARRKDVIEKDGAFAYAKDGHEAHNMQALRSETWRAMEDAVYSGKCRAIGVSNFTVRHLEALKSTARIWPPAVNQIELHPYNPQTELVDYCKEHNIVVQAYASLGGQDCGKKRWNVLGGRLVERSETLEIAKKHGKTPAQVLLKWSSQQGFVVIPKSTNVDHLKENFEAVAESWSLDDEDMTLLASINKSSAENGSSSVDNDTEEDEVINDQRRLCWVRDPLKMLDFD
mmetsp:Transcript_11579/g.17523  ORF Transcript_11579/g.17523 Transcript_11579/m.17523 type:complete len:314 (+) Transcript_11579:324-1265(+)